MRIISSKKNSASKRILCLGYDESRTKIISELSSLGNEVWHSAGKLVDLSGFDLVVSFGYRYILKGELVANECLPIVNLHISYLPFNRGAHPNFWAFFDSTPTGVTIHLIDEGIDTGDILFPVSYTHLRAHET